MAVSDEIRQGEPRTYDGVVTDGAGDAVDCTGYSLKVRLRAPPSPTGLIVFEADSLVEPLIVDWTNAATGLYSVALPSSATTNDPGIYDFEVRVFDGGEVVGTVSYFSIRILDSLFVEE